MTDFKFTAEDFYGLRLWTSDKDIPSPADIANAKIAPLVAENARKVHELMNEIRILDAVISEQKVTLSDRDKIAANYINEAITLRAENEKLLNEQHHLRKAFDSISENEKRLQAELAALKAERENAPVVTGKIDPMGHSVWSSFTIRSYSDTHTARLVDIKEIGK